MRGPAPAGRIARCNDGRRGFVRGILLWLVGIPIPVILLLYLFNIL
ncbi:MULTISPECIES: hypothetical protein [unclassified Azospirillum]